jgi:hypothetical protein
VEYGELPSEAVFPDRGNRFDEFYGVTLIPAQTKHPQESHTGLLTCFKTAKSEQSLLFSTDPNMPT